MYKQISQSINSETSIAVLSLCNTSRQINCVQYNRTTILVQKLTMSSLLHKGGGLTSSDICNLPHLVIYVHDGKLRLVHVDLRCWRIVNIEHSITRLEDLELRLNITILDVLSTATERVLERANWTTAVIKYRKIFALSICYVVQNINFCIWFRKDRYSAFPLIGKHFGS